MNFKLNHNNEAFGFAFGFELWRWKKLHVIKYCYIYNTTS